MTLDTARKQLTLLQLGQLIDPFWTTKPDDVPNMVLYTAIIVSYPRASASSFEIDKSTQSTVAALPAFFIPAKPPTPPSASSSLPKTPLTRSIKALKTNRSFWVLFVPFSVYVGFFNAFSSLLNQILEPYGFSETNAGKQLCFVYCHSQGGN